MSEALKQKIQLPLFFCRLSVFLVYLAWTWDKLFNAAHGAGIMRKHYSLDFVTTEMVFALGFAELLFILAILLGFYKRITRGLILIFSLISAFGPLVRAGYMLFLQAPDGAKLDKTSDLFLPYFLYPGLAMLVCCFVIYIMRDYDTLFSYSKADRALKS